MDSDGTPAAAGAFVVVHQSLLASFLTILLLVLGCRWRCLALHRCDLCY